MRARKLSSQLVTVRKLVPQAGDEFGDASVEAHRATSFTVKMQVMYNRRETSIAGAPGRDIGVQAMALVEKAECDRAGWTPEADDLVTLNDGESLFIRDVQPESAKPIRLGNPTGGWLEWRLTLSNAGSERRAAGSY